MGKRRLARTPSGKEKHQAKSKLTTWAVVGGVVVIMAAIIVVVIMQQSKSPQGTARVGSPAPDFTLNLLNGQSVALSSLKGKPVLVNFWAST